MIDYLIRSRMRSLANLAISEETKSPSLKVPRSVMIAFSVQSSKTFSKNTLVGSWVTVL